MFTTRVLELHLGAVVQSYLIIFCGLLTIVKWPASNPTQHFLQDKALHLTKLRHMRTYPHMSTHPSTLGHTHTHTHTCAHTHTCPHIHTPKHTHMYAPNRPTHTHTQTHLGTHTHTHPYIRVRHTIVQIGDEKLCTLTSSHSCSYSSWSLEHIVLPLATRDLIARLSKWGKHKTIDKEACVVQWRDATGTSSFHRPCVHVCIHHRKHRITKKALRAHTNLPIFGAIGNIALELFMPLYLWQCGAFLC